MFTDSAGQTWLSIPELAKRLGCARRTVQKLITDGTIVSRVISEPTSKRQRRLVLVADASEYVAKRKLESERQLKELAK